MRKLTLVPIIALLSILLLACGTLADPTAIPAAQDAATDTPTAPQDPKAQALEILRKSAEAMTSVKSGHITADITIGTKGATGTMEMDLAPQGNVRMKLAMMGFSEEVMVVDGKTYVRIPPDEKWEVIDTSAAVNEATKQLQQQIDVYVDGWAKGMNPEMIGSEVLYGVYTDHLKVTLDGKALSSLFGKTMPALWPSSTPGTGDPGSPSPTPNLQQSGAEMLAKVFENMVCTGEVWIGKDDHYIHQMTLDLDMSQVLDALATPAAGDTTTSDEARDMLSNIREVVKYSKLNEPIEIAAPPESAIKPTPQTVTRTLEAERTEAALKSYPVDYTFDNKDIVEMKVPSVDVLPGGRLRVNYLIRNVTDDPQPMACPNAAGEADRKGTEYLLLDDGRRLPVLEDSCTATPEMQLVLAPGATWDFWEVYPPLPQGATSFRIVSETNMEESDDITIPASN